MDTLSAFVLYKGYTNNSESSTDSDSNTGTDEIQSNPDTSQNLETIASDSSISAAASLSEKEYAEYLQQYAPQARLADAANNDDSY